MYYLFLCFLQIKQIKDLEKELKALETTYAEKEVCYCFFFVFFNVRLYFTVVLPIRVCF